VAVALRIITTLILTHYVILLNDTMKKPQK